MPSPELLRLLSQGTNAEPETQPKNSVWERLNRFAAVMGPLEPTPEASADVVFLGEDPEALEVTRRVGGTAANIMAGFTPLGPLARIGAGLRFGTPAINAAVGGAAAGVLGATAEGIVANDTPAEVRDKILLQGGVGAALGGTIGLGVEGAKLIKGAIRTGRGSIAEIPMPTLGQLERSAPNPNIATPEKLRAFMTQGRTAAYGAAFKTVLPDDFDKPITRDLLRKAHQAGRRASKGFTPNLDEVIADGQALNRAMLTADPIPVNWNRTNGFMNGLRAFRSRALYNVTKALRTDSGAFKDVGPVMATSIERMEHLRDRLEGEFMTRFRDIVDRLTTAEKRNFTALIHRETTTAISPRALMAARMFRQIDDQAFRMMEEANLHEVDLRLSSAFKSLAPQEREAIRTFVEHGTSTGDAGLDSFGQMITAQNGALEQDLVTVPIRYLHHHAPKFMSQRTISETLKKGTPENLEAIRQIRALGNTEAEAQEILKNLFDGELSSRIPGDIRAPFQWSREMLINAGWERNPDKWLPKYAHDLGQRISAARAFGGRDEVFRTLYGKLKNSGGDAERLNEIFYSVVGRPRLNNWERALLGITRPLNTAATIMFLGPKTTLLQLVQLSNTAGAFGGVNTARGFFTGFQSPAAIEALRRSGALLPSLHHAFDADQYSTMASGWVSIIGQSRADKAVRAASAFAAGISASQAAKQVVKLVNKGATLQSSGRLQELGRFFNRVGLSLDDVVKSGGQLSDLQLNTVMLRGAHQTQFSSSVGSLPELRNTVYGQAVLKFKGFALQQARYIDDVLIAEAKHGNFKPILRYAASLGTIYAGVGPIIEAMQGKQPADDAWDYLSRLLYVGALGAYGDAATAVWGESRGLSQLAVPPGIGATETLTRGARETLTKGDPSALLPNAVQQLNNLRNTGQ